MSFLRDPAEVKLLLLLSDEFLLSPEIPLEDRRLSAREMTLLTRPRTLILFLVVAACLGDRFLS